MAPPPADKNPTAAKESRYPWLDPVENTVAPMDETQWWLMKLWQAKMASVGELWGTAEYLFNHWSDIPRSAKWGLLLRMLVILPIVDGLLWLAHLVLPFLHGISFEDVAINLIVLGLFICRPFNKECAEALTEKKVDTGDPVTE